jgi:hypothetical protein
MIAHGLRRLWREQLSVCIFFIPFSECHQSACVWGRDSETVPVYNSINATSDEIVLPFFFKENTGSGKSSEINTKKTISNEFHQDLNALKIARKTTPNALLQNVSRLTHILSHIGS